MNLPESLKDFAYGYGLRATDKKVKKVRVPEIHRMLEGTPLTVGKVYDVIESCVSDFGSPKSKPTLGVIIADDGNGLIIRFNGCAILSGCASSGSTEIAWEIVE